MAAKLSPQTQIKLAALRNLNDQVQHVHGLVERFAATRDRTQAQRMALPMKRAFARLKLDFLAAGYDAMSQLAGSMELAAGRSASPRQKARILREGVGSLRYQVQHEQRRLKAEAERNQQAAERAEAQRAEAEQDG